MEGRSEERHWINTTMARLLGGFILFALLTFGYTVNNLRHLKGVEGHDRWLNLGGQRRSQAHRAGMLAHGLFVSNVADVVEARTDLREVMGEMDAAFAVLREGDGTGEIPAPSDERVAAGVDRLQNHWHSVLRPLLQQILGAESPEQAATGLATLNREISGFVQEADEVLQLQIQSYNDKTGLEELQYGFGGLTLLFAALVALVAPNLVRLETTQAASGRWLRTVLNSTADGIITINEQGTVETFNASAERIFGYRAQEVIGQNVSMLAASPYREEHDNYLNRYHRTGEAHILGREREVEGQRKDGSTFPLALRISELHLDGTRSYIGTARDITGRKEEERQRERTIRTVREVVDRLGSTSSEVLAATTQQATSAQEQAAAVAQTMATVDQVSQSSQQAADRAKSVLESVETSNEIGKQGREVVSRSVTSMQQVSDESRELVQSILALADQAQDIGEIVAKVTEIADQTNLLALNAAIEASRAGEHGKGFSVVAGEVKELADQSKKATGEVRRILGEIQRATRDAVKSAEVSGGSVGGTMEVVNQAGDAINKLADMLTEASQSSAVIAASANQQAIGVSQIGQTMRNINESATQARAATAQSRDAAKDLADLARSLTELLEDYGS